MRTIVWPCLSIAWIVGCGGGGTSPDAGSSPADAGDGGSGEDAGTDAGADAGPIPENLTRDIRHTGLVVDLATLRATASIELAPEASTSASFEVGALTVLDVRGPAGPLRWQIEGSRLDVLLGDLVALDVEYEFPTRSGTIDGWLETGSTLIWPYYCGNLFPCHSEPADGLTFDLVVDDPGVGLTAVYPETITTDAPSYQIAWAVGDYSFTSLGETAAGTEIGYWTLPGGDGAAAAGTDHLIAVFDWFETALGPYPFGNLTGPVAVNWPPGAFGGMEHHPYWHVAAAAMNLPILHTHEASHGWYGGGVRLLCWEDLVLSEGTATYLAARATGQAIGAAEEASVWADYERVLDGVFRRGDRVVLPDGCGEVDVLVDGLFSQAVYYKGAFFYRAVADSVGADALDRALGAFFSARVGEAARMQDMLDTILDETGFDPTELADAWLRGIGRPAF